MSIFRTPSILRTEIQHFLQVYKFLQQVTIQFRIEFKPDTKDISKELKYDTLRFLLYKMRKKINFE